MRLLPLRPLPIRAAVRRCRSRVEPADAFDALARRRVCARRSRASRAASTATRRMRHRLEYAAVRCVAARSCACCRCASCARCGTAARPARSTRSIARTAASPMRNLAAAFPARADGRAPRDRARDVRALRPAAARAAEVQHAARRTQMLARVEFEGEERVARGVRAGQGRAVLHRPLRLLGAAGDRARAAAASRSAVLARAARQPAAATSCSSGSARAPATRSSTARARSAGCCATLQAGPRRRDADRSAHAQPPTRSTSTSSSGPAATTSALAALALRTGAPVVPVFALPLPGGRYRMIYEHPVEPPRRRRRRTPIREFTQRCTDVLEMYVRRHPELWLWMHRRWRDAPLPAATPGMFPPARADEESIDVQARRVARAGAELAGRRRDGAAGDRGSCAAAIAERDADGRGAASARAAVRDAGSRRRRGRHARWARRRARRDALRRDVERLRTAFDAALLLPNSFPPRWLAHRARDSRALGLSRRLARRRC